jgi:hypothetical protein
MLPVVEAATGMRGGGRASGEAQVEDRRGFSGIRLAVAIALAGGLLVNLLGVVVNFDTYINVEGNQDARHWEVGASPIVGHLTLFEERVREWTERLRPRLGTTTTFKSGFSYSEGDRDRGELLPRWTTGMGMLEIRPAGIAGEGVSVTLRLSDNRPPELPRTQVKILEDGAEVAASAAAVEGQPASTDYTVPVGTHGTRLTIESDTWNPAALKINERNEDLGLRLEGVRVTRGGASVANELVEGMAPAPPYYPQPRWYYDPDTHHPADLWFVYLLETGMGRKAMLMLALPVLVVALLLIIAGERMLWGARSAL